MFLNIAGLQQFAILFLPGKKGRASKSHTFHTHSLMDAFKSYLGPDWHVARSKQDLAKDNYTMCAWASRVPKQNITIVWYFNEQSACVALLRN